MKFKIYTDETDKKRNSLVTKFHAGAKRNIQGDGKTIWRKQSETVAKSGPGFLILIVPPFSTDKLESLIKKIRFKIKKK